MNVLEKVDQPTLLLCSWQSWRCLCHTDAFRNDILDLHPRDIPDQDTHSKPAPSKAKSSAVQDSDDAGMGTQIRIPVAQLRMK